MKSEAYGDVVSRASAFDRALDSGDGIVRLAPTWVPRVFCTPGRRLRLHPDDYYPFERYKGGIDERWMASTVRADNGPLADDVEGLSLVVDPDGNLLPFDEFTAHHGAELLGDRLWADHQGWPMYAQFFDNNSPLPFHVHHTNEMAGLVGLHGKPEAYYYSPHMNAHLGTQPVSFLGLRPDTSRDDVLAHLRAFSASPDNRITDLSHGYRTKLGTGWDIPAGVLHAPASVCTYEPQSASDVGSMWESWSDNRPVPEALLWKDVPESEHGNYEFLLNLLEWDVNTAEDFTTQRAMVPYLTDRSRDEADAAYEERWVVYRSPAFSAKELVVRAGATVTLIDPDPYGAVIVQGTGQFGRFAANALTALRYGQLSEDEFFVSQRAARAGVKITNLSTTTDLVILKHFGPGNSELGKVA